MAPLDFEWPAEGVEVPAIVRGVVRKSDTWKVATPHGPRALAVMPVLAMSANTMVRDAVVQGAGVARLPLSLVSGDLAAGRLALWGDVEGANVALWALYPSRRLLSVRVSAFLDYLRQAFPQGTPEELAAYLN